MKRTIYLVTFVFFFTACNQNGLLIKDNKEDAVATKIISDDLKADTNDDTSGQRKNSSDSLILADYASFHDLELNLIEISRNEFQNYKNNYKTGCDLDSGDFISGSGLYVSHNCDEICETYLAEKNSGRRMLMPSDFDAGILSMLLSPNCRQLIVCSSYDGPDYVNYCENRAEFYVFTITLEKGLDGIVPASKYFTKDYSIDDLTWVTDNTIALKVYEEQRWGDGSGLNYTYFKADLAK